jgi:hypothetical protein
MSGITLPYDVADKITLTVLEEQLSLLREEIKNHTENGVWMHPEDYHNSMTNLIPSLEIIIKYFGGDV